MGACQPPARYGAASIIATLIIALNGFLLAQTFLG
jgi:hypothetical protein